MKVGVLGSSSFCGGAFCEYLEFNQIPYWSFARRLPGNLGWSIRGYENHLSLDINLESSVDRLIELIDEAKITHIVNFISLGMVAPSWENPSNWYMTNFASLARLLKKLEHCKSIERYLHFSTPEVYGDTGSVMVDENFRRSPSTPYALSRYAADLHIDLISGSCDFDVLKTRASNVYGPGQQLYRLIPKASYCAISNSEFFLDGGGGSQRNFLFKTDMSEGVFKVLTNGRNGAEYHISGSDLTSIDCLVKKIFSMAGGDQRQISVCGERKGKDAFYALDATKIREECGWSPVVPENRGIELVIEWMRAVIPNIKNVDLNYVHKF